MKIIYSSQGRSGSSYGCRIVSKAYGLPFHGDTHELSKYHKIKDTRFVIKCHGDVSKLQERADITGVKKVVSVIRDPRQLTLSSFYFNLAHYKKGHPHYVSHLNSIDPDFVNLEFKDQIRLFSEMHTKFFIDWSDGFLDYEGNLDIKVMRYEDMAYNSVKFFTEMLEFLGGDYNLDALKSQPTKGSDMTRCEFRKGDPEEFRSILDPSLIDEMNSAMSNKLKEIYR